MTAASVDSSTMISKETATCVNEGADMTQRTPPVADADLFAPRRPHRRAVFVDRDGVINQVVPDSTSGLHESPLTKDAVQLLPGAVTALQRLRQAGWLIVCVTNQPAAAKGRVTEAQVMAIHERVAALLGAEGAWWDATRVCLHHPDGVVAGLSGGCACRKPKPGMLLDAAAEFGIDLAASWMIGDTDADIEAGRSAGVRTVLVRTPETQHKRSGGLAGDITVDDLEAAAAAIDQHLGTRAS